MESKSPKTLKAVVIWAAAWLLFTALAYSIPNDALAAYTIFPAWTWIVWAVAPAVVRWRRLEKRLRLGLLAVSLLLLGFITEEWRSLIRFPGGSKPGTIRVVTFNCASLSAAAREVIAQRPDIILLSENPGRPECERLAQELFGDQGRAVVGLDGAILARAPLEAIPIPRGTHNFAAARTVLNGVPVGLIALRLRPPEFNVALFTPDAWRNVANNRRQRRVEIAELAEWVAEHPEIRMMAGDYNAQPWDPSLRAMPKGFADTFHSAGRGWGHSAVNEYPLARIDQIWTRSWPAIRVWAVKSQHSDHRIVVGEFEMPQRSR